MKNILNIIKSNNPIIALYNFIFCNVLFYANWYYFLSRFRHNSFNFLSLLQIIAIGTLCSFIMYLIINAVRYRFNKSHSYAFYLITDSFAQIANYFLFIPIIIFSKYFFADFLFGLMNISKYMLLYYYYQKNDIDKKTSFMLIGIEIGMLFLIFITFK